MAWRRKLRRGEEDHGGGGSWWWRMVVGGRDWSEKKRVKGRVGGGWVAGVGEVSWGERRKGAAMEAPVAAAI